MTNIGVFWIYQDTVIGRAVNVDEGKEYIPGIVDGPDDHVTLWEKTPGFLNPFPELYQTEYQTIPRGRVLYDRAKKKSMVYMDKSLFLNDIKVKISIFFGLKNVVWRSDPHYTTDPETISNLFEDDWR